MKPDYENLFEMTDPLATRPWRLDVREDPRWKEMVEEAWEAVRPRVAPGNRLSSKEPPPSVIAFHEWLVKLRRGEAEADPPLRLVPAMGGHPTDVMWATTSEVLVVSQRVVNLLKAHGITGWATYAVEVRDKKGNPVPGYYGFAVTGKAGEQDLRRGEVIDKPPIVPGGKPYQVLRGIYFEDDYWDGNDFCLMGTTLTIIVTRRVVQLFKRYRIRNVEFIRLPEVEVDVHIFVIQGLWPPPGRE